jgi:hypothetical protein
MVQTAQELGFFVPQEEDSSSAYNKLVLTYYHAWIDWIYASKWAKTTTLTLEQWFLKEGL